MTSLKNLLKKGKYIPLSQRDKLINDSIVDQPFKELINYPDFELIKNEIIQGIQDKKTTQQIASSIGHKTGLWGLDETIAYYKDIVWNEARIKEIKIRNKDRDPLVFKTVTKSGCCDHCNMLYLTNGVGSKPKLFRLSELEGNGSNEQRSESDWKPTVFLTHKNCSCVLWEFPEGFLWNDEKQSFSTPDPEYKKQTALRRPLLRVLINGKEHFI